MNDGDMFEAIYSEAQNAIDLAVEEPKRCQVRPRSQRRPPTDGVSDRTRPGD